MMQKYTYRKGSIQDVDQLRALGLSSYGQYQKAMAPEEWVQYRSKIDNHETFRYLMKISSCFLCEDGNSIVGMAFLVPKGHPTDLFDEEWSYIRMVGVHPSHSGQGIAKRLTQMCIDFANETKEEFIALHTSEFMDAARHIYEGFGFKVCRDLVLFGKQYWIYLLDLNIQSSK